MAVPSAEEHSGYLPAAGAQLHYRHYRWGAGGEGEPRFLFLHGFTRTGDDQWGPSRFAFLRPAFPNARVLVPDMRGHGFSRRDPAVPQPPGVPHRMIGDDLEAVVESLAFAPAHFIGFSSGAIGMLYLALRRPELFQSLILISASYMMTPAGAAEVWRMRGSRQEPWYADMVAELDAIHAPGQGAGHGERVLDMWVEFAKPPLDPDLSLKELRRIECPVLLVHGDRDRYFPVQMAADMHMALPSSHLCVLPDCGHFIRQPANLQAAQLHITEFLRRFRSARP
jgi:pimeloyl-ACP methyl ester carboxylesterase